ncbi:hypothetical protein [Actinomadura sp. DC4]|uniref:hypothetical protein n=1 Tax=Actinomadura sp. DC4 TaxID=3055069 RepID=UPI0025B17543|nr:hypothetical protein [Actinomadura sp. DC4]MDN3358748.1 hypothetical protein [Actinomadura sp. DC4]
MTIREIPDHRARTVIGPGAPEFRTAGTPSPREPGGRELATPEAEIFGWDCTCGNGSSFPMTLRFADECVVKHVEAMARYAEREVRLTFTADPTATGVAALIGRLAGRIPALLNADSAATADHRRAVVEQLTGAIAAIEKARSTITPA